MSKNPKSFRLSDAALQNLAAICEISGVNETAAVEMALATLAIDLKGKEIMSTWTEQQLRKWLDANRPDLSIDEINGIKGFYRKDKGQAASFQGCGKTWKDVAAYLGAI